MIDNILDAVAGEELVVIDAHDTPKPLLTFAASLYISNTALRSHGDAIREIGVTRYLTGATLSRHHRARPVAP